MARLVFVDVDDTLLTPPYAAVRRAATLLGKKFPGPEAFRNRSAVDYHVAFPELFSGPAEMWAVALMSLPFGHFRSQDAMPLDVARMGAWLADHRLYLVSKNPPSFTRWRVRRLEEIFGVAVGDRYIACGPMLRKGPAKLGILERVAAERGVALHDCLLVDDSAEHVRAAAAAGVTCALVRSSWNVDERDELTRAYPKLQTISCAEVPDTVGEHLGGEVQPEGRPRFVLPPLTPLGAARLAWTLLKRQWLFDGPMPQPSDLYPVARSPLTSYFYGDPHADVVRRLKKVLEEPTAWRGVRLLPLTRGATPFAMPIALAETLGQLPAAERVRALRTACRAIFRARGHTFVRDAMFYFTELNLVEEKRRVLSSARLAAAKASYAQAHGVTVAAADELAANYAEELLTSRSYVSCVLGEKVLDAVLGKILKRVRLQAHPQVAALEKDHFLLFAATHRSYLDSAVLWSLLSHHGQSFPFAVGADKMRTVWFGRLGVRGGTFFIKRRFVDEIYAAIIAEHVARMQQPGSVLEVFLEGQRSRSGLTLPPKRGIASIVWENMGPADKVAIVPVSFTYNKIPESEKLIKERFDEREKQGQLSLRERADMQVRQARRKTRLERVRGLWRRVRTPAVSEAFVHYAEPIVLHKSADRAALRRDLNEAMLRINSAAAILPSSVLCLYLLGARDGHATAAEAVDFLRLTASLLELYRLPGHLTSNFLTANPEGDVRAFAKMPFVNRKFKRVGLNERELLCIDGLDVDRATYYKNNVLHFFVLPAILCHVLNDVRKGRVEELHRCFDQVFAKLQVAYFLPEVGDAPKFINALLQSWSERGWIATAKNEWAVDDHRASSTLFRVLAGVGAELVQQDLPSLLTDIRRASDRTDVKLPATLVATRTMVQAQARVTSCSDTDFFLHSDAEAQRGDEAEFIAAEADIALSGTVVGVQPDVAHVQRAAVCGVDAVIKAVAAHRGASDAVEGTGSAFPPDAPLIGRATLRRAQSGDGCITNLSPSGAFVATTLHLRAGEQVVCRVDESGRALHLQGRVVRVTEAGVGVRFEPLEEADRRRLVSLNARGKAAEN